MISSTRAWTTFAFNGWALRPSPPPDTPLNVESMDRLRLMPLLFHAWTAHGVKTGQQFDWSDAHLTSQHAAASNLMRLAQGRQVCNSLEASGIPVVVIKGGAFLVRYQAKAFDVRPMSDLDFLVPIRALADAERVLRECGFEPAASARHTSQGRSFVRNDLPTPIEIDLHGAVAAWPIATGLTARILNAHERVAGWRVPRLPDSLCLTALHRAYHGFLWPAVDLFEFKAVSERLTEDDWREVVAFSLANRSAGAVWTAYRQAVWLFGATGTDAARLATLASRLSPIRRRLLTRIAPDHGVLRPDPFWRRPLPRILVVGACATASLPRTVVAAAAFVPARITELWGSAKARGLSPLERARVVLESALRGDETSYN
jgi:hypothetical protein